jgi:multidrug efflux pump subunit AcrA (membrane-fusion protein)
MIFREEALAYYAQEDADGSPLRGDSCWGSAVYYLVCGGFVAALLTAALVPLHRYAAGPAIIRAASRTEVTVSQSGTISRIAITAGAQVRKEQLLIELDSDVQRDSFSRVASEVLLLEQRLLRNPADQTARAALLGLRAQKRHAEAQLLARQVRAPTEGRVLDVHLRLGQHLQPGDVIASIAAPDSFSITAMLPGYARPALAVGGMLRVELDGYRYHYLDVSVQEVTTEVLGPELARRTLGVQVADSLQLEGPLALVKAALPKQGFRYDDQSYAFFDGMRAKVEVRMRSESALLALIPGLREVMRHVRGR